MSLDDHRNPNGTYDGVGVMSELTSLPRDEIRAMAELVKANQARLRACAYHEFERDPATSMLRSLSHQRYICRHCGGSIGWHEHHWHELGRRAKGDAAAHPPRSR